MSETMTIIAIVFESPRMVDRRAGCVDLLFLLGRVVAVQCVVRMTQPVTKQVKAWLGSAASHV